MKQVTVGIPGTPFSATVDRNTVNNVQGALINAAILSPVGSAVEIGSQ